MIEAKNKRIKYDFLFPVEIQNFKQTKKQLEKAVSEYNDKPYLLLHGLTPNEVFNGKIPDKIMFSKQISEAKDQRIAENLFYNTTAAKPTAERFTASIELGN